jgi:Domain of unknown function (DUF4116)
MPDIRSRLKKILDLHGQALLETVCKRERSNLRAKCVTSQRLGVKTSTSSEVVEREELSEQALIHKFADIDPTPGKSRTQWLVKTYIRDEQFKWEDLGRAHAALAAFERFKPKLPREQRELCRLISLRELESLIDPLVKAQAMARLERDLSTATGRELRRLEEWKARDESIIISSDFSDFELKSRSNRGEGNDLPTIVVPMTEFASKWWGRGTKWCTSAETDNRFASYHKDAPIIIIVRSNGVKLQAYVTKDIIQFMDAADKRVGKEIIRAQWNELKALVYWMLKQNGEALEYVPVKLRSPELCRIAVEQNGMALEYTPENYKSPELCRIAVEQNGLALQNVYERTPELCRLAVVQNGRALLFVPREYRTAELCRLAIEQNGLAIYYVPHDLTALPEKSSFANKLFSCEKHKPEFYRLAIERNGVSLFHVPEEQRTPELCYIAVKQNGQALQAVPEKHQTPELYHMAVEQNGLALGDVPENYRTPELCRIALEQNGQALKAVPEKHRTSELYRMAIEQDGLALQYVTENYKTLELCLLAVEQDGRALQFVPEELKTPEFIDLIPSVQPKWHPDILQDLLYTRHG